VLKYVLMHVCMYVDVDFFIMGDVFLKTAYTVFDPEQMRIGIHLLTYLTNLLTYLNNYSLTY